MAVRELSDLELVIISGSTTVLAEACRKNVLIVLVHVPNSSRMVLPHRSSGRGEVPPVSQSKQTSKMICVE